MNYLDIKKYDIANGPGVRVSLFVSGCTHHCKGCFNPESWDFKAGNTFTEDTINEVLEAIKPDYIKGFSLLGGEPLEPQNQSALVPLLKRIKELKPDINIWCYTGYLFDKQIMDVMAKKYDFTREILKYIDVIVDGEYHEEEHDLSIVFRGSRNQRIIDVQKSLEYGKIVLDEHNDIKLGGIKWKD